MPDRTPEEIGREAGKAIADSVARGLEPIIEKLLDRIVQLQHEQGELRDEMLGLSEDHRRLEGAYMAHIRQHHGG